LGPLRLLASEIYETLSWNGVYTNLFTGQEKRVIPFATHSAATVEMTTMQEEYEVAVIDEIQMIADPHRGYAWSRALLGLRCKEIHVCGGMEAIPLIQKIAKSCGDEFELLTYSRFTYVGYISWYNLHTRLVPDNSITFSFSPFPCCSLSNIVTFYCEK
jgi:ATP-dependent RNA helicase SUPV3L1/SUV3